MTSPTEHILDFETLIKAFLETQDLLQNHAQRAINTALVVRNWLFGYYIVEFEQSGAERAEYGQQLLSKLAERLKQRGLKGCSETNLKGCRQFYLSYTQIGQTLSDEFKSLTLSKPVLASLSQHFQLSWSHYQILMRLQNHDERRFYEIEALTNHWKVRELGRQVDASLYERLALSRDKEKVMELAKEGQKLSAPQDIIKDPYVLEFLGLETRPSYSENDLETAIIDKLEHFLLELGKGFLFEARQKRFSFDEEHFIVDLVFYNRLLRCFVLIDLKIGKLTHQDLGQMQMYVNYFDRHVKLPDENPSVGIVLCKRKKDALIELTLPQDANIFASQYQLYLPSKEELRQQIEAAVQETKDHQEKDSK